MLRRSRSSPGIDVQCAASLALVSLLGACGGEARVDPDSSGPEAASEQTAAQPLRVVGLTPSLNELVIAMGGAHHLAARTDYDDHPASAGLPSIGGGLDPSLEVLVGLEIDLVLMVEARETPALAERLAELGIRVAHFPSQTISDIYETIDLLGRELGLERSADSLASAIRRGLEDVEAHVAAREPVPVMYVVWSDPPMTTGGQTFIDEVIRISGGRNVFADAPIQWPTVGFESIVERDPEIVLWPAGDVTTVDAERLRDTPGWREVPAVREGRIVLVDGDLYGRPGPNVVEAARHLAALLHPSAF